MKTVGAYEAKTHLPHLLALVEGGDSVTITKHGREVARLVPVGRTPVDAGATVDSLREARRNVRRGKLSVRRMIDEGRR
jgi:prevent-host-death family protein